VGKLGSDTLQLSYQPFNWHTGANFSNSTSQCGSSAPCCSTCLHIDFLHTSYNFRLRQIGEYGFCGSDTVSRSTFVPGESMRAHSDYSAEPNPPFYDYVPSFNTLTTEARLLVSSASEVAIPSIHISLHHADRILHAKMELYVHMANSATRC
jgi:hypothetical protein